MSNTRDLVKILVVIRYPIGGIRTYLKYLYGNLDKRKYSFVILTPPNAETKVIKEDLRGFSVEIKEVKGKSFLLSFGNKIFDTLFRKKIDIIHSQGSSSGIIVSLINILFRVPHIITFHETFHENTLKGSFASIKKKVISSLLLQADFLNTVSQDAKNNLLEYFPLLNQKRERIVVIQNGIDTAFFSEKVYDQKNIFSIDGINKDSFVIGYLGRFMPEKGFPVLIDAIGIIDKAMRTKRNIKVLALGWGAFIREYQVYIRENGLNDYFVFIEFQTDIRWVLRQINLLVIPSLREAYGLIAVEGLVCGTPIVASNCIGLREVLKDTPAKLVNVGDSNMLAEKILETVGNYDQIKQACNSFVSKAVTRFDVKESAFQMERLFKTALK